MRTENRIHDDARTGFISVIGELAERAGAEGLTIREIRDRLDERAYGLMILILAVPCLVPAVQGVPQVVALPMILLAGQMMFGRVEPWLPEFMLNRRVSKEWLDRMARFADRRMRWFETMSRPRLQALATGPFERIAAFMIILATVCILPPITNTVPSLAITLVAVGLLERDGVFVGAGVAIAAVWATALLTVVSAFLLGAQWAVDLAARFGAG
jgi:hypothetical protein